MNLVVRQTFVDTALKYLGYNSTPFESRYKPVGPNGDMSCSGFICWLADEIGLLRPISKFTEQPVRTSREMFYFWGFPVGREKEETGDLVFFSDNGSLVTHMGIYLGKRLYLHSPGTKNGRIEISQLNEFKPRYFNDGYFFYKRTREYFDIVFRQNPVGFNRIL